MTSYREQLLDPRWQRQRLAILARDAWTCQDCGATERTLHVDHGYYETGVAPWEYPAWSLRTLCVPCHQAVTSLRLILYRAIARWPPEKFGRLVMAILDGYDPPPFAPEDERATATNTGDDRS